MNYSQLPQAKGLTPQALGQNAIGFIATEQIDGKWTTIFRPREYRVNDKPFMKRFAAMARSAATVSNPCIMRPAEYVADDRGGYYAFDSTRYTTLRQLLAEKPGIVADEMWTADFLDTLLTALGHLHRKGLMAVELTPTSILVGKQPPHKLMLLPPASDFADIRRDVWTREDGFIAPEVFDDDQQTVIDARTDLYGAARIIEHIYQLSEVPPELRSFIQACTQANTAARPADVEAARHLLKRAKQRHKLINRSFAILTAAVIVGLLAWGMGAPDMEMPFKEPDHVSKDTFGLHLRSDESLVEAQGRDIFDNDSIFMLADTSVSLSPERKAAERRRMKAAEKQYKQQYERVAVAILTPVYSSRNLHGDQQNFMLLSTQAMQRLQDLAISMQKQYQLDPTTAEALAGEVIEKVTDRLNAEAATETAK